MAIIKVNGTESNDVIKRHSNVITIWWTSTIEVTALLKNIRLQMEGPSRSVWHHSASLVVQDSNPWDGFFCPPLTSMIDPYNILVISY